MGYIATLLTHWKAAVCVVLALTCAALFAQMEYTKLQKSELAAEIKSLKYQLSDSQTNIRQLSNDISAQNTAIERLKTEADERLAKKQQELAKAQQEAVVNKNLASDIMKKRPPQGVSVCDATNLLFNEAINNVRP